jgi:hypothetical protein
LSVRDAATFELREALARPGCPICFLTLRSVGRFIRSLAYERVNDLDVRADLRAARGFCNVHAHRWLREAHSVLGTALIYRDVVRAALGEWDTASNERGRVGLLDRLRGRGAEPPPVAHCLACDAQHEAEERYLSSLAALVAEPTDLAAFTASDGLCLVHTMAGLRRGDAALESILAAARQRAERLVATLDEVIRKEDYRFQKEPRTSAERSAPADVVAWSCGADGLV